MLDILRAFRLTPYFDNREWLIGKARQALTTPIPHITDHRAPLSPGGPHDYYSNGDYWWPNPDTPDGLPYIRRDGETNPDNFDFHRLSLRRMRDLAVYSACGYMLTGEEQYARRGTRILYEFFVDPATCMNPSLDYAQAIAGICPGRGIGVIDTLHLIDIPFVIETLRPSQAMTEELYQALRSWFSRYLGWMLTSPNGIEEMNTENNHCVCFFTQAAAFALFTDHSRLMEYFRMEFKNRLMAQMAPDGSFPLELARTKPYNYSAFVLDNMVTLCYLLSTPEENLWEYRTEDGRSIETAIRFMAPYLTDKTLWPYPPDVMHFDAFPVRYSFLMFAGCTLGMPELISLFCSLPCESEDEEARRNLAVQQPMLWMMSGFL